MKQPRAPVAKPGELKMRWGKMPGGYPEMCLAWGEGCSKRDSNFLHYALASPRPTANLNASGLCVFEQSFLDELASRGYDLTTLKFTVSKKVLETK